METIKCDIKRDGLSMQVDKNTFALALKTWRLRQGLTQKEVGRMWNVSRYTIIRAENGSSISWEQAYKLFARLSVALQQEQ